MNSESLPQARKPTALMAFILGEHACIAPQETEGPLVARSFQGAVASASPLATEAGVQALEEGGTSADASVAPAFALTVTQSGGSGSVGCTNIVTQLPEGRVAGVEATVVGSANSPGVEKGERGSRTGWVPRNRGRVGRLVITATVPALSTSIGLGLPLDPAMAAPCVPWEPGEPDNLEVEIRKDGTGVALGGPIVNRGAGGCEDRPGLGGDLNGSHVHSVTGEFMGVAEPRNAGLLGLPGNETGLPG